MLITPGLSPRLRGNHHQRWSTSSIPLRVYPRACGGTASLLSWNGRSIVRCGGTRLSRPVYPRACGGTLTELKPLQLPDASGLSPRLRGNLRTLRRGNLAVMQPVYPRACGGTGLQAM